MYSIFLYDTATNEYAELDTENINFETVFSISDISDISTRKDTITKSITFKGTSNNNIAFGNLFNLNKYSNPTSGSSLFYNFTPIKRVDCLVYEDNMLLINGELIITGIDVDKNGNIFYQSYITGKFVGFKGELGDKTLTDIDFTDLKHRYYPPHIVDSWGGYIAPGSSPNSVGLSRTQRYDPDTDTYYYEPFQLGSGYIYPFIDYGEKFQNSDFNQTFENVNLHNYRAAIWVKEYFNRIFKSAGYTYQINGDSNFQNLFNRLIVPNTAKYLTYRTKDNRAIYSNSTSQSSTYNRTPSTSEQVLAHPIKFQNQDNTYLTDYSIPYGGSDTAENKEKNLLVCKRNFTSDAKVVVSGTYTGNILQTEYFSVQLVKRAFSTDATSIEFEILGEQKFKCEYEQTISFNADFIVPEKEYTKSDQIQVRILQNYFHFTPVYFFSPFTITTASLEISKDENTFFTTDVSGSTGTTDLIVPEPPTSIKQFDFIKSVINLLNLYCYTKKETPKHLIFEQYDYYYSLSSPLVLKSTSLDWTNKVDLSAGIKYTTNAQIPKNYIFSYKEDADYINKYYKDRYSTIYGTKTFTDSLGSDSEKKVDLIFSPSPMINIPGNYKYHPSITEKGLSLAEKSPIKSNIRILIYNGVHACTYEKWGLDSIDTNGNWGFDFITAYDLYANCSNYLFNESTDNFHSPRDSNGIPNKPIPLIDLNFSSPSEYYFTPDSNYNNLPTAYDFYKGQITELTNPNLFTIECEILLNEIDISNLDLKVPVFMDLGNLGHGYFKVLKVEYANNNTTSKVTLQKI